ncbi:Quinonprotein alcohol dehydrogenase-like superfamily [Lasallia pustulata]|uniref:ER membrane protein complex subunit 1 n=1 Tax=Lasallia pustulata TaxID=136370 RepID=A0A1W5CVK0_9LECA|nr:Quinonprotein alcohol dehydrogenase-like superfamily [Lasallia pustulata]
MRNLALSLRLFLFCLLPTLTLAVFADEAYQTDYHHALVGVPQSHTTFFHRPSVASKASLLYTLSDRLVLGAVNPKDGTLLWRQRLVDSGRNVTSRGFLSAGDGESIVVSAVDGLLRAWDAADGRLVWEWSGQGRANALEVVEMEGVGKDVVVIHKEEGQVGMARRLSAATGDVKWEFRDESGDIPFAVASSPTSVYYISLHSALLKGFKVKVTELDPVTGKETGQNTLSSDSDVSSEDSILFVGANSAAPLLVWTDKAFKVLKINNIGSKHTTTVNIVNDGADDIEKISVHAPRTIKAQPHFLVHYQTAKSHWAEVYHVDLSDGSVSKAYSLPRVGGRGAFSTSTEYANVFFTRNTEDEVSLVASVSHGILGRWPARLQSYGGLADHEGVSHAVSEVVPKGDSTYAVRSAVTLKSGDWELIRNGEPVWIRTEGLTGVVAAAWADLAEEAQDLAQDLAVEGHQNIFAAYEHRVRRHVRDLQHLPAWLQSIPSRVMASFLGTQPASQQEGLHRDSFGFRKLIIAATEHGRLVALDTGRQGYPIWSFQAVDIPMGQTWDVHDIEVHERVAIVKGPGGQSLRVDTVTGNVLQRQSGGSIGSLETFVSVHAESGEKFMVPILADGSPGDVSERNLRGGTTIVTQGQDGTVRGWVTAKDTKFQMAWEFVPMSGEKVLGAKSRPMHDPVASLGKVLGDRNVLYKYLNPNLLLVTTVGVATSTLGVYLLDSISGDVLYTTTHFGVDTNRPITSIISENWFAYSMFCDPVALGEQDAKSSLPLPKAHQLVVSELFESPFPNDRGPLGSSPNVSALRPAASENGGIAEAPHVKSQAFVIPAPISHMSIASTLQGITPRSLLCVLPSLNALIAIPRNLLDPRRPVGREPTAAEMEEGLFKYNPVLEFDPKWFLNHQREVAGLEKVITSPTLLESTSLVFAFGDVDMFGTRVAPIGGFDVLGKGFNKLQLVGTVVALAIGTGFLAPMVRKKQIDGRWKA